MKLISCHIENFGGLCGYDLEFSDGLTTIREENGFGKTTLAEFIRAMFYGLPARNASKTMGRRQKYKPWNGGKYGGNLTFEHEEKQYRIERFFGGTPKADTFKLIDLETGTASDAFTAAIGLELFGLDSDSFERSTYLPQNRETGPLSTDSIQAKLGGLVEDENDVGSYEQARRKLEEKRKIYIPLNGAATRGTVAEAGRHITELQRELAQSGECARELEQVTAEIAGLEQARDGAEKEIAQVRSELAQANVAAARLAHHQQLERLENEYRKVAGELTVLKKKYPKGLPGKEELEQIADAVERLARIPDSPITPADENAQRYVEENEARFGSGAPTEEQIAGMRQVCDEYRNLSAQWDACVLSAGDAAEMESVRAFLAPGIPGEERLARFAADLEEAERLRRENLRLASTTTVTAPRFKVPSPLTVPLLAGFGAVGIIAAVILFVMDRTAPGGIALGLGLMALLAAGYVSLRGAMTRQVPGMDPQVQTLIRENETRAAELETGVRVFTGQYTDAPGALTRIREQAARLRALEQRQTDLAQRRNVLSGEMQACNDALRGFFTRYFPQGYTGSGYDLLARLQRESDAWERALCQLEDRDQRIEAHRQETAAVRAVMGRFREQYGLMLRSREQVMELRDDARRAGELEQDAKVLARQVEEFRRTHADTLAGEQPDGAADLTALQARERELLAEQKRMDQALLRLQQRHSQLAETVEQIPQIQDRLALWQECREADMAKARLLDDTMAFLEQARTDLALAYMGPIRESFTNLMGRMAGESREKILVSPELVVSLERGGESRKLDHFSAGQTDLVMLCMRLSLVDALFREAKPFVILDDPFVNLDDRRTEEALKLLQELARDRQIIYLTCNSSRV